MSGRCVPNSFAYLPFRISGSAGFTPLAITRTRISFSFGSGTGTSSYFNTSGPPYSCATIPFIVLGKGSANADASERVANRVQNIFRYMKLQRCLYQASKRITSFRRGERRYRAMRFMLDARSDKQGNHDLSERSPCRLGRGAGTDRPFDQALFGPAARAIPERSQ